MLLSIARFELFYWLKGWMVWIFLAVTTLILCTLLLAEDTVLEDLFFSNGLRNSPFVVARLYAMVGVFSCLMVTAFVNSAASRDFTCDTAQLVFSKPIRKIDYLGGRFLGAFLVSLIPCLGVPLAVMISQSLGDAAAFGPNSGLAYLNGFLIWGVLNTFLIASVVFVIAVWTRSSWVAFIGVLGILVVLGVSDALLKSFLNESIAALAEPFGDSALALKTKYWTVADRNTMQVWPVGGLLVNRLLWVTVGGGFLMFGYLTFSFSTQPNLIERFSEKMSRTVAEVFDRRRPPAPPQTVRRSFSWKNSLWQTCRLARFELLQTFKSPVFICLVIGVMFMVIASLLVQVDEGYDVSSLPVTFRVVDTIREVISQLQIALITFFVGVYVWQVREMRADEIQDSMPVQTTSMVCAKLIAMFAVVLTVLAVGIGCGVLVQLGSGFVDIKPQVYFQELLVWTLLEYTCLIALAFACHVVAPNKYVGYALFVGLVVLNFLLWPLLEVESRLFTFASLPERIYSDMFGLAPYLPAIAGFGVYWLLAAALLALFSLLLWPRGKHDMRTRIRLASGQLRTRTGLLGMLLLAGWVGIGGWLYWNTMQRNDYQTAEQNKQRSVNYERSFREHKEQRCPRVTEIKCFVDIFPAERKLVIRGEQTLVNKNSDPIESFHVSLTRPFSTQVEIEQAELLDHDTRLDVMRFQFDPPLEPGQSRQLTFSMEYQPQGVENSLAVPQVVQNGTFFNNFIFPQVGYQPIREVADEDEREEFGLGRRTVARLDPLDRQARRNHYISHNSDWIQLETTVSTAGDQVAIAPGSLVRHWQEAGRNYFQYRLDHKSLNFFAIVSARYKVALQEWNGVDIEVYHHPEHHWNVDLMLRSIRKSLEYYTEHFGPYRHRQARIIEFPRVQLFAQAFPGSMPYSEGVGFVADLKNAYDIDMVYYVVAHEIAHQWWAHQVIGANMYGATLLSETLAQYSALMVMEKEFGKDKMRKFLKFEMDRYLRSRGTAAAPERPLSEVGPQQSYIHYNKGSLVMYHVRELIGEEALNRALKNFLNRFAYQTGNYPTSTDLIEAIAAETPAQHQAMLADLFDRITVYENRVVSAEVREVRMSQGDSNEDSPSEQQPEFEVTMTIEFAKYHADGIGNRTSAPLDDWIEIGAVAPPKNGQLYGETLYRKRVRVQEKTMEFTFMTSQRPERVGVDPFALLVDRNQQDNMVPPGIAPIP